MIKSKRFLHFLAVFVLPAIAICLVAAYVLYPWYCRWETTKEEATTALPRDNIVHNPKTGYTLAISISAPPSKVWPWLVQIGQGRGGFYTHEWIENLIGADIHNANQIIRDLQNLAVGDSVRLTPDPYRGQPGQYMVVAELQEPYALVFRQVLPNGELTSWAFVLRSAAAGQTRLLSRRRGGRPTLFDRVMKPGYYFMDRGSLSGIKNRAEGMN